jgi:antitoxin (DNA-binding transcriptional repressor) of toxin-antitoxin stability system
MTIVDYLRMGKQLSRLLRRMAAGKEIVMTKAGGPVALAHKKPRRPGRAAGRLTGAFFDPLPADELAAWEQ